MIVKFVLPSLVHKTLRDSVAGRLSNRFDNRMNTDHHREVETTSLADIAIWRLNGSWANGAKPGRFSMDINLSKLVDFVTC